jgi:hypothetical protein
VLLVLFWQVEYGAMPIKKGVAAIAETPFGFH